MLSMYLAEQQAQHHAASLDRALAHQERVHRALAHRQRSSTTMKGRYARVIRWLYRHIEAWGNRLGTAPAEEHL
jgi:hypothetical protein